MVAGVDSGSGSGGGLHERAGVGDGGDGEGQRALRADARRNRGRILEAAWRLLATSEPAELSMEDVAHAAGIGKGTLYRHYPTRDSLFTTLFREGAEHIITYMQERIPPEADAETKLRAVVALCYDAYEHNRISIDLILGAWRADLCARADDDIEGEQEHPISRTVARVRAILEQGIREGVFRSLDLDYTAMAVFSLISPIAFVKQRDRLGYSRAELEARAVDLILHALRTDS